MHTQTKNVKSRLLPAFYTRFMQPAVMRTMWCNEVPIYFYFFGHLWWSPLGLFFINFLQKGVTANKVGAIFAPDIGYSTPSGNESSKGGCKLFRTSIGYEFQMDCSCDEAHEYAYVAFGYYRISVYKICVAINRNEICAIDWIGEQKQMNWCEWKIMLTSNTIIILMNIRSFSATSFECCHWLKDGIMLECTGASISWKIEVRKLVDTIAGPVYVEIVMGDNFIIAFCAQNTDVNVRTATKTVSHIWLLSEDEKEM